VLVDVSATGLSAERWVDALVTEGVLVRSLGVHHGSRSWLRVTVGTADQNTACLGAFERVLSRSARSRRSFVAPIASDAE